MSGNDNYDEGSSSVLVNEKGRNKRKFSSDQLPPSLSSEISKLSPTEFPRYENLVEKFRNAVEELRAMVQRSGDTTEEDDDDFESDKDSEWDDSVVSELEEILSHNIFSTFCSAVKKIVEYGYTEQVAEWAILNSSFIRSEKDLVSNVVEPALAFLRKQKEFNTPKHSVFDGLESLVDYTLLEMISVLREVRPDLNLVNAMWALLISDLNIINACNTEGSTVRSSSQEASRENQSLPQSITGTSHLESKKSCDIMAAKAPAATRKEDPITIPEAKRISSSVDEKSGGSGKGGLSSNEKRDLLRQKMLQYDKSYRGRLPKGAFKAKIAAWSNMVLDKSLKSSKSISSTSSTKGITVSKISPPVDGSESKGKISVLDPPKTIDYYASIPFNETLQKHVPQDSADEAILLLGAYKKALEDELQMWTDWGNEKVMQAAQRLKKDKPELQMLKQEKEEMEKYKREKQMMEENTMKRLSEMEYALSNATGQIEVAKCTVHRLEQENIVLVGEMEAAKEKADKSAGKLGKALKKEQEYQKSLQTLEAEKGVTLDQLTDLKRQAAALSTRVEKAKARRDQFKTLLKQEEKEKLKVKEELEALVRKREEDDALVRAEEENIKRAAELDLKKYDENIKSLQNKISKMRLEANKSKIAALNVGYGNFAGTTKTSGSGDVSRERECVMCMTEEIAVVFIPCAHQVLCENCSAVHEQQGMKDCPSCRTLIQKRITVAYR